MYRLTGSALWLGIVTFCQQGPSFLLATLGGLLADHYRRRTILVVTQSSSMALACVLAALTLSGRVQVGHVIGLAVLLGAVGAVDSPTRQAFVLEMVGREHLTNAIGLNTTMFMCASFLGPAIAGVAIKGTNALIQSLTPDALRGRVMAIWTMILMGFVPVGSLVAGSLATAFGPRVPLVAGGIACALGAIGFVRPRRRARSRRRRAAGSRST